MSYIIGIDPDSDKSGFAVWHYERQRFGDIKCMSFFDIIDFLTFSRNMIMLVRIEAGWLNKKSNWHFNGSSGISSRIGLKIGMNQMVGKLLVEYCNKLHIPVEEVKPLGTKNINSEIFKENTGWDKPTNQDSRDAALLVWKYGEKELKHEQTIAG